MPRAAAGHMDRHILVVFAPCKLRPFLKARMDERVEPLTRDGSSLQFTASATTGEDDNNFSYQFMTVSFST